MGEDSFYTYIHIVNVAVLPHIHMHILLPNHSGYLVVYNHIGDPDFVPNLNVSISSPSFCRILMMHSRTSFVLNSL